MGLCERGQCACLVVGVFLGIAFGVGVGILIDMFVINPNDEPILVTSSVIPANSTSAMTTTTASTSTTSSNSSSTSTSTSPSTTSSTTSQAPSTHPDQVNQCAVSAAGLTHGGVNAPPGSPLVFSTEMIDYPSNTSYNHTANVFKPTTATAYFINVDVSTSLRSTEVTFKSDVTSGFYASYYTWYLRHTGNKDGEGYQIGRNNMRVLQVPHRFGLYYQGGGLYDTNTLWYNGVSIFNLGEAIQPRAVFNMARDTGDSNLGHIGFHRAFVNYGDNLPYTPGQTEDGEVASEYPVQFDGIYYFSYTFGTNPNKGAEVHLYVDDQPLVGLTSLSSNLNGSTTVSRSVMTYLRRGSKVSLRLMRGEIHSSRDGQETSLLGFLYLPRSSIYQAWSVSRGSQIESTGSGRVLPTTFDSILLNEGSLFDPVTNKVTIRVPGIYYIQANSGVAPGKYIYMRIWVNSRTVAASVMNTQLVPLNGPHAISKGTLLDLKAGDEVWMYFRGTSHSQKVAPLVSFTGFLVYSKL